MPLGDSITAGYGVAGGYREPLATDLTNAGIKFEFTGAATTGATPSLTANNDQYHNGYGAYPIEALTANLAANNQYEINGVPYGDSNQGGYWVTGNAGLRPADHPDIVLLEIGTNNFLQDQGDPVSTFDTEISTLITSFHSLSPNTRILVAGAIPVENNPAFNARISAYDSYIQNTLVPSLPYTTYVNLYADFTNPDGTTIDSLYQSDSVHPDQAGYDTMATAWAASIQQVETAPEPSTYALLALGIASLGAFKRKRFGRV
jgi:lysophospholipase L1-like esterase